MGDRPGAGSSRRRHRGRRPRLRQPRTVTWEPGRPHPGPGRLHDVADPPPPAPVEPTEDGNEEEIGDGSGETREGAARGRRRAAASLVAVQPAPPQDGTGADATPTDQPDDGMYHPSDEYDDGMYHPSDEYDDGMWTPDTGTG
ncbi:hypothetical protein NKG05_05640 [Oerskovia sp. M15]